MDRPAVPITERKGERFVVAPPNYESTAAYFATALIAGQVEKGAEREFLISLIEQVRYLTQTDLPAVQRVIDRIKAGR